MGRENGWPQSRDRLIGSRGKTRSTPTAPPHHSRKKAIVYSPYMPHLWDRASLQLTLPSSLGFSQHFSSPVTSAALAALYKIEHGRYERKVCVTNVHKSLALSVESQWGTDGIDIVFYKYTLMFRSFAKSASRGEEFACPVNVLSIHGCWIGTLRCL